MYCRMQHF